MTDKKQEKKAVEPTVAKPGNLMEIPIHPDSEAFKKLLKKAKAEAVKAAKDSGITDGKVTVIVDGNTFEFMLDKGEIGGQPITAGREPNPAFTRVDATDKPKSGINGLVVGGKDAKEVEDLLKDSAEKRAEFWEGRTKEKSKVMPIDEKNVTKELGEDLFLLPTDVHMFLMLPIETQIATIKNALHTDMSVIHSRDFQRIGLSRQSSKRLLDNKFLSLEFAVAHLAVGQGYGAGVYVPHTGMLSGITALADKQFARNNKARQYGNDMVFNDEDLNTKLLPYQLLSRALLAWVGMSNLYHTSNITVEKNNAHLNDKFVLFAGKVSHGEMDGIRKIATIMSGDMVKAVCRNWHYYVAKEQVPQSFADAIRNGYGRTMIDGNPFGHSDIKMLHDSTLDNKMLKPLYEVQRRMLKGEMSAQADGVAASLFKMILGIHGANTTVSLSSIDGGTSHYMTGRTVNRQNYGNTTKDHKAPTIFDVNHPYEAAPTFARREDLANMTLTADNFDTWAERVISFIGGAMAVRRSLFTQRDHNVAARPLGSSSMGSNRGSPPTPQMQVIPMGGKLTPLKPLLEFATEKTIADIMGGAPLPYTLDRAGLAWSSLLDTYARGLANEGGRSDSSWHDEHSDSKFPVNARLSYIITAWEQSRSLQREHYANLMKIIDAALTRKEVRLYDLLVAAQDMLLHSINLAEACSAYNNSLVLALTMEGIVIDDLFRWGVPQYGDAFSARHLNLQSPTCALGESPDYGAWDRSVWND